MDLQKMFAVAKKINHYNDVLQQALPPPLNQLRLAQIIDNQAIFIVKNATLLASGQQQAGIVIQHLKDDLCLDIEKIQIKLSDRY